MQRAHSTRGKIDRPHGGATSSIRESKVSVVLVPWCTEALHKLIITLLPLKPGEPASRRFDWGSRWHRPALLPEQEQPPPGAPSCKSSPCWSPLAIIIYAIAIKVSTMSHLVNPRQACKDLVLRDQRTKLKVGRCLYWRFVKDLLRFYRPESDHCLPLSLTYSLTSWCYWRYPGCCRCQFKTCWYWFSWWGKDWHCWNWQEAGAFSWSLIRVCWIQLFWQLHWQKHWIIRSFALLAMFYTFDGVTPSPSVATLLSLP